MVASTDQIEGWQDWDTHPKTGAPFLVGTYFRYNPFAKTYEVLTCGDSGERRWVERPDAANFPSRWHPVFPDSDVPTSFWFEVNYRCPPTLIERLLRKVRRIHRFLVPASRRDIIVHKRADFGAGK